MGRYIGCQTVHERPPPPRHMAKKWIPSGKQKHFSMFSGILEKIVNIAENNPLRKKIHWKKITCGRGVEKEPMFIFAHCSFVSFQGGVPVNYHKLDFISYQQYQNRFPQPKLPEQRLPPPPPGAAVGVPLAPPTDPMSAAGEIKYYFIPPFF